jgi:hypothetical protein
MSILVIICACFAALVPAQDLQSQVQLLMKSPDLVVSGTYPINARRDVIDKMLGSPLLLSKLWEAYQFSPAYRTTLQNGAIHVDDPTGITGDVFLVEQSATRRVYFGTGNLNHSLVPAFRGRMALVLTMAPKGTAIQARLDAFVRTDSRVLGMLAWTMGPLVKPRVENRMNVNAGNMATILQDLNTDPQKSALMLKNKADAAALLKLLPPPQIKK